jgi:phage shock protein C
VPTVIGYVALAFLLQPRPADLYRAEDEAQFWRQARTAPQGAVSELRDRFRSLEARLDRIEGFVVSEEYELRRKFRDIES